MIKTEIKIDGMMCPMCEAHVTNAIRTAFSPKKVTASHKTGLCEVVADRPLDEAKITTVLGDMGYRVLSVSAKPAEKKGFFARFRK